MRVKILVTTDGSESSNLAVKLASREALAHEAELTVLHAIGCTEMVPLPIVNDTRAKPAPPGLR